MMKSMKVKWKITPRAWWPQLPGKSGDYAAAQQRGLRLCRQCHDVTVKPGQPICGRCQLDNERKARRSGSENAE